VGVDLKVGSAAEGGRWWVVGGGRGKPPGEKGSVFSPCWIRARTKGEGGNLSDENETDRAWSDSIETFPKSSVSPAADEREPPVLLPDPQDTLVGGGGTKDLKELFCLISALLLDMVSPFPPIRLRMSLPADLKSVVCDVSHFDPIRGDLTCPALRLVRRAVVLSEFLLLRLGIGG